MNVILNLKRIQGRPVQISWSLWVLNCTLGGKKVTTLKSQEFTCILGGN